MSVIQPYLKTETARTSRVNETSYDVIRVTRTSDYLQESNSSNVKMSSKLI